MDLSSFQNLSQQVRDQLDQFYHSKRNVDRNVSIYLSDNVVKIDEIPYTNAIYTITPASDQPHNGQMTIMGGRMVVLECGRFSLVLFLQLLAAHYISCLPFAYSLYVYISFANPECVPESVACHRFWNVTCCCTTPFMK